MELSTWRTPAGDVDILRNLPAPDRYVAYDDLVQRSKLVDLDGHRVRVASLEDLIVSKETVDRPTDREALPELRALRDRQQPPPPPPGPRPSGPGPTP
jgi:predicted nucleotidyltransferase